jgi:hypothetical protein
VPPSGVEVDNLDAGGVHRDRGRLTEEGQPSAVCTQADGLIGCSSVEDHRVEAVLPLDHVAAVARIPAEAVVAFAEVCGVGALAAGHGIVAFAAAEALITGAAGQRVVAVPPGDRRRDRVGERPVRVVDAHGVVAVAGLHVDRVDIGARKREVGGLVVTDVHLDHRRVSSSQTKRNSGAEVAIANQDPGGERSFLPTPP